MRHSRGYLLNEMILILALLAVIALLSAKPMRIFSRGVMDTNKAFERHSRLETLLGRLQHDTENAALAFVRDVDERLGGRALYLAGAEGAVVYQFSDGVVTRLRDNTIQEWDLAPTAFDWRLLTLDGGTQAVAITTQQRHHRRGEDMPAFRGSRVFIVNLNAARTFTEQN